MGLLLLAILGMGYGKFQCCWPSGQLGCVVWYAGICEEANVSNKFLFLVGHNLVTSSVFPLDQFLSLGNKK